MDLAKPPIEEEIPAGENLLAEIPALAPPEKKEEEKKRGGAPWLFGLGRSGGGALGGALDGASGSLAVPRVAVGARALPSTGFLARAAQSMASLLGRSTLLGGLFASSYGPSLVLAGLAAWAGLIGAAAWRLASERGSTATAEPAFTLGPGRSLGSRLALGKPRDLSLDFLARANRNAFAKDAPAGSAAPGAEAKDGDGQKGGKAGAEAAGDPGRAAEQFMKGAQAGSKNGRGIKPGGAPGRDGSGLGGLARAFGGAATGGGLQDALASARLGGNPAFAMKDMRDMGFKPSSRLADFENRLPEKRKMTAARVISRGAGSGAASSAARNPALGAAANQAASGFQRGPANYASSGGGTPDQVQSGRAMGQLKYAEDMSSQAQTAPSAGLARQAGLDAFEQARTPPTGLQTGGGGIGLPPNPGLDPYEDFNPPVVPPIDGGGAPDLTVPGVGPGVNLTPYQGALNATKNLADSAARFKMFGMALIATGGLLMAVAIALQLNPFTSFIAAAVYAIAVALIGLGVYLMSMSTSMANQAKGIGSTIGNVFQQKDQGQIVNECVDQAVEGGVRMDDCKPSTEPAGRATSVREDVAAESATGYAIVEGGGTP